MSPVHDTVGIHFHILESLPFKKIMNHFVVLVVFFSSLLSLGFASNVVVLNAENFDEFIEDHKFVLVNFFAPWYAGDEY